ncbi:MAG: hypothetical protein JXA96_00185 [Sedimentisphaerales bacterium]|nr:hypothetical protein [Sedimentisphaerales bacterium]
MDVRKVSINIAVIFFFSLSIVTLISGLSPFTCCKRAIIGAVIVYIAASIAVRLINLVLIDAMVSKKMEQFGSPEITKKVKERGIK